MADLTYEEQVAQRQEQVAAEIDDAKKATMEMGIAFEELTRMKGFEFIKANYMARVQAFTTKAINSGFTSMEEYALERGKILGMQQMLNDIDAALKALADERSKQSTATTTIE